ncbi:MAG: hypothetical protein ACREL7_17990 [Longimicrobiales bacterium]
MNGMVKTAAVAAMAGAMAGATAETTAAAAEAGATAGATAAAEAGVTAPASRQAEQDTIVPAGFGTLRQDDVTMTLRSGPLLIKVTPLAEPIIRLLAPDTYQRLRNLAASKRTEASRTGGLAEPAMFMVSFFSYQPDVEYVAEDLQFSHQGNLQGPIAVLPVTPAFGRQRLAQQDQQVAVYAFNLRVDYQLPIVIRYGLEQSDQWVNIIPKLEVERAKVRARARGKASQRERKA